MRRPAAGLGMVALLLAGCSHPSSTTYDAADIGRTIETSEGSVLASRIVEITGGTDFVGPVAGGAAGAATSGLTFRGSGGGSIAVLGGLVGGGAGYLLQQVANNRQGIEYVLKMDDGRVVTLVQNREDNEEEPLADGTPVLVQISGQYTRVMVDPRAERFGHGDWIDPDAVPPVGTEGTGEPIPPRFSAPSDTGQVQAGQRELQ